MLVTRQGDTPKNPHTGRLRILVVEDDPDTAKMLGRILDHAGYICRTVHSYRDALKIASEWVPDGLVSDIGLPGKDGLEVMKTMRKAHPGLKGIVVSGHVQTEDMHLSRSAGFDAHLAKPITADQLVTAVRQLFAQERQL